MQYKKRTIAVDVALGSDKANKGRLMGLVCEYGFLIQWAVWAKGDGKV